ncbi:MAG TPA: cupin domain-containing protein [Rhodanobacteraceae bacterium]|nr:cupin domain-containing protein [Rhodanobacteraceae bacterium]
MQSRFPSAEEYEAEKARYSDSTRVDIRAHQAGITRQYKNEVLSNINGDCLRLSVLDEAYPWHYHADSDELFLVVEGKLQVQIAGKDTVELTEWQYVVVPAGTIHRTRAIGRTVTLTFEKQAARTVFVERAEAGD